MKLAAFALACLCLAASGLARAQDHATVEQLDVNTTGSVFPGPREGETRNVWVWRPPNAPANQRLPVLYMADGLDGIFIALSHLKAPIESGAVPPACLPGSARGITSLQIKDKRIRPTGGLQFKIKGKRGSTLSDPVPPLERIQVSIGLAAQTTPGLATAQAKAGQCVEAVFTGNPIQTETKPFCRTKIKNSVLDGVTCKGL